MLIKLSRRLREKLALEDPESIIMDWKRKAHALALELEVTEGRLYLATEANKTRMHDMMLLKSFVMERMGCALSELNSMHGDVLQIATSTVRASFLVSCAELKKALT